MLYCFNEILLKQVSITLRGDIQLPKTKHSIESFLHLKKNYRKSKSNVVTVQNNGNSV